MNKALALATATLVLSGCGGADEPQQKDDQQSVGLIARQANTALEVSATCPQGGYTFEFGFDSNGNGILDVSEVDPNRTQIICAPLNGIDGQDGLSAYDIWKMLGNEGTEIDFLLTLVGDTGASGQSAYELWLAQGNEGNEAVFLASLMGEAGTSGESAYQIWLSAGNTGTEAEFLASLIGSNGADGQDGVDGEDGLSAYQIWLQQGNQGSEIDFLSSLAGETGASGQSAYELWLAQGNEGSEAVFLASLMGETGATGATGDTAYQIWLSAGNTGTEAEFLASLVGAKGSDGNSAPTITSSSFFYLDENAETTYTATAYDADNSDELSFSLAGGEDLALFQINSENGELSFINLPDFENPLDVDQNNIYEVDLQVTDGQYTTTKALYVKVRNIEVTPVIESLAITSTPLTFGTYETGETISVDVKFDYSVNVSGMPVLGLGIGENMRMAQYQTGSGTDTLTFAYEVIAEDVDVDGISIPADSILLMFGASITSSVEGNSAAILDTVEVESIVSQKVANDAPTIESSTVGTVFTQAIPLKGIENQDAYLSSYTSIADKDNDGDLDILYSRRGTASWLINGGDLSTMQRVDIPNLNMNGGSIDTRDINGDGYADILVTRMEYDVFNPSNPLNGTNVMNNMSIYLSNNSEELVEHILDFKEAGFARGNAQFVDIDNDGDFDIVLATGQGATVDRGDVGLGAGAQNYGGRVLVVINDGTNNFTTDNVRYFGLMPQFWYGYMLDVVDLNNDDLPELVVVPASQDANVPQAGILHNTTTTANEPSFTLVDLGFGIQGIALKPVHLDVNKDGFQDVLIAGLRQGTNGSTLSDTEGYLTLLTNNKDMTFSISDFTDVPSSYGALGAGDFDKDGFDDFAYKLHPDNATYSAWYKGKGDGTFERINKSQFTISKNDYPAWSVDISVADLTGDNRPELVSILGRGAEKSDATHVCGNCLDIWQNKKSMDVEIDEHIAIGTVITQFNAVDVESRVSFSLRGTDAQFFSIDSITGEVKVTVDLDYELPADLASAGGIEHYSDLNARAGDNRYQITIVASDGTLEAVSSITVVVDDLND